MSRHLAFRDDFGHTEKQPRTQVPVITIPLESCRACCVAPLESCSRHQSEDRIARDARSLDFNEGGKDLRMQMLSSAFEVTFRAK